MNRKARRFPVVLACIILISVAYGAISIGKSISIRNQKMEIIKRNEQIISELDKDIKNYNSEIENASTSDYIEKVAREDLGMVKPREIIYVDKSMEKDKKDSDKISQQDF
ncbi:FtsB family cell division protein [Peptoniphilus sp.]|jgi:cell division protein DivIC|uniref:FtsB family cell division protein n=1 Tax=Peptoniphilus sp. TaxID=1971214 RepID=UPI003D91D93F